MAQAGGYALYRLLNWRIKNFENEIVDFDIRSRFWGQMPARDAKKERVKHTDCRLRCARARSAQVAISAAGVVSHSNSGDPKPNLLTLQRVWSFQGQICSQEKTIGKQLFADFQLCELALSGRGNYYCQADSPTRWRFRKHNQFLPKQNCNVR